MQNITQQAHSINIAAYEKVKQAQATSTIDIDLAKSMYCDTKNKLQAAIDALDYDLATYYLWHSLCCKATLTAANTALKSICPKVTKRY